MWILGPWLNSKLGGIWGPLGWKGPKCGGGLLRSGWRVVGGWETPGCKDVWGLAEVEVRALGLSWSFVALVLLEPGFLMFLL